MICAETDDFDTMCLQNGVQSLGPHKGPVLFQVLHEDIPSNE